MTQTSIAAVVLQYGQWQKTANCVESLLKSTLPPKWIIVVDNASTDDSVAQMEAWLLAQAKNAGDFAVMQAKKPIPKASLILLQMTANGGYAAGNNAGMAIAMELGADAVLIINNDAVLAPTALQEMATALFHTQKPGLCGPIIVYPLPGEPVQCLAGGRTNYLTGLSSFIGEKLTLNEALKINPQLVEKQLNFICGACVLASSAFLKEIGPMNECFFLYCEEEDWALRAKNKYDLTFASKAVCYHHEGASTGFSRHSFHWQSGLRIFLSRLRLAWLHHPLYIPTVILGCFYAGVRLLCKRWITAPLLTIGSKLEKHHKK